MRPASQIEAASLKEWGLARRWRLASKNVVSRNENTAHLVSKYKNTHYEAEIFMKIPVWGRKKNYVSLHYTALH